MTYPISGFHNFPANPKMSLPPTHKSYFHSTHHNRATTMASNKNRTIPDLFRPARPKRLKTESADDVIAATPSSSSSSALTAAEKSRMEFQKLLARARRNLSVCSVRVASSKSKGEGVKLKELLVEETWVEALPAELEKPYAISLNKFVESEISGDVGPIYPPTPLIFNALNSTPFDRVKAVILGQDPYHGPHQAMGLSFSVPEGVKVPSSLVNIFKELHIDVGCSVPSHGNLEKWAVQGVLLLNTVLTVRRHKANSHAKKGWEQFTDAVIKTVSQKKEGVVFLLWGNFAQQKACLINVSKHHILRAPHPSGLSAHRGFFGCRHFSRTNQLLEEMGVPPIDWQL